MSVDVILIDDEQHLRTACRQALELADLTVDSFASAAGALDAVGPTWPGVVVSDVKMADRNGLELMADVLARDPELPVILITGHGDIPMAVQAMRDGAYDFIEKPFANERLVDAVRRALEKRRLVLENRALKESLSGGSALERQLIGQTTAMRQLRAQITSFANADADVLVVGETGTGKELVARSLHDLSPRAGARFVPINCGALPETIIESELFGHEAGAFTGAAKPRVGRFEYADGGTLFLDEIESMPLDLQTRLLRVLQNRNVVRLGANEEIDIDIRVVAAAKEDLQAAAERGAFRTDLFYRLNVLTLTVPPLRDRRDDIPQLFAHFRRQFAERFRRDVPEPAAKDLARLTAHDWPGNVRELQNVAMRFALGFGVEIRPGDETAAGTGRTLPEQLADLERLIIQQTLAHQGGSLKSTYEALGISRKTLYDKMQRYGLGAPDTPQS